MEGVRSAWMRDLWNFPRPSGILLSTQRPGKLGSVTVAPVMMPEPKLCSVGRWRDIGWMAGNVGGSLSFKVAPQEQPPPTLPPPHQVPQAL